eukprot:361072-Chlamydomonas_euryale.AAC.1
MGSLASASSCGASVAASMLRPPPPGAPPGGAGPCMIEPDSVITATRGRLCSGTRAAAAAAADAAASSSPFPPRFVAPVPDAAPLPLRRSAVCSGRSDDVVSADPDSPPAPPLPLPPPPLASAFPLALLALPAAASRRDSIRPSAAQPAVQGVSSAQEPNPAASFASRECRRFRSQNRFR